MSEEENKADKCMREWLAAIVAIIVLLTAAGTSIFLMLRPIPEQNEPLVGQVIGALWTALGMVVAYFFGSSRSSHQKDDTIAALTKQKPEEP